MVEIAQEENTGGNSHWSSSPWSPQSLWKHQGLQWAHQPRPAMDQQLQAHFYVSTFWLKNILDITPTEINHVHSKTFAAYQLAHLFSGHILLPFLFHLQKGSVSSFFLGIELNTDFFFLLNAHKLYNNSQDPSIVSSPNFETTWASRCTL